MIKYCEIWWLWLSTQKCIYVCQEQNDMLEIEAHLPHLYLVWSLQSIVQQFIYQTFNSELCLNWAHMTDAILTAQQILYIGFRQCDFTGVIGLVSGHWNLSAPWGVSLTHSLWCHQNQLRGLTPAWCGPAQVWIKTQGLVILPSKCLQACVLGVRTDTFLPVPADWFHLVIPFRKINKVSELILMGSLVSDVSGGFWLVSWQ